MDNKAYGLLDISGHHFLAGTRGEAMIKDPDRILVAGLKREFESEQVLLFVKAHSEQANFQNLMDILKRIAMGIQLNRPPGSPHPITSEIVPPPPERINRVDRRELRRRARQHKYVEILKRIKEGWDRARIMEEYEVWNSTIEKAIAWDKAGRPDFLESGAQFY